MIYIVTLITILVIAGVVLASTIKIIHPYQKGVIEQLGKYKMTVDPGLRIIIPVMQTIRPVDMREQVIDVPPQEVITQDNVAVSVDAVVYFEPTDPQRLLYNISNFVMAVTKLAQTNLRNVVGEMSLDEAFTSRERVNADLRNILDEATDKWGVRVVRVEIQRIDPPADVMSAMHEQMKAERTRRAVVTEADGAKTAAITRAEGDRESAILSAQGQKESAILKAQGLAESIKLEAEAAREKLRLEGEGEGLALTAIKAASADDGVLAVKYLETLSKFAQGDSTKILIPNELSGLSSAYMAIVESATKAKVAE